MAKRGDRDAQFNVALRYQDGIDGPRDYEKARHWYRQAANQGHTTAQYSLGLLFAKGLGRSKDMQAAAQWYRMAAEGGHQAAQFNLAQMYEEGRGVPRDLVMAYVWFTLAGASPQNARQQAQGKSSRSPTGLLPVGKGKTVAEMHRMRLAQALNSIERDRAARMAEEYYARHVRLFR